MKFDKIVYIGYEEIWKPVYIKGMKTKYIVSNLGNIKNKKRPNKILQTNLDRYGYEQVCLMHNKKRYTLTVHRIVAEAFIPNPDNKPEVNHKDGIKIHNEDTNLEWCTTQENIIHAYKTGLHNNVATAENHGNNKYSTKKIKKVCKLLEENKKTYKEISEITGVKVSTIKDIRSKKYWTRISSNYDINNYNVKSYKYMDKKLKNDIINLCKICNEPKIIREKLNLQYSQSLQIQLKRYIKKYYNKCE